MIGGERAILLYSIFEDKAAVQRFKARLQESTQAFSRTLDKMVERMDGDGSKDQLKLLRERYNAWLTMRNEIVSYLERQQVGVAQNKLADPRFGATVDDMHRMAYEISQRETQVLTREANSTTMASVIGFGALATVSFGIGVVVFLYIRRVSVSLGKLSHALAGNSGQVESLSADVHASSESLARGSSEQAAALEETSASTEEITAITRQKVEHSQSAAEVMTEVDGLIKAGNRTLDSMLVSMQEINASSDKISKIIRVIDEIAFQTNIMA
jgi:methyl-accepting chemotaxis protein